MSLIEKIEKEFNNHFKKIAVAFTLGFTALSGISGVYGYKKYIQPPMTLEEYVQTILPETIDNQGKKLGIKLDNPPLVEIINGGIMVNGTLAGFQSYYIGENTIVIPLESSRYPKKGFGSYYIGEYGFDPSVKSPSKLSSDVRIGFSHEINHSIFYQMTRKVGTLHNYKMLETEKPKTFLALSEGIDIKHRGFYYKTVKDTVIMPLIKEFGTPRVLYIIALNPPKDVEKPMDFASYREEIRQHLLKFDPEKDKLYRSLINDN
jgi:hypothetical protein